jgi:acyl-CoA thioester hydrolase
VNRPPSPEPAVDGTGVARAVHRARVEWMDTDAAGHHHNTAVVRFVEAAEATLIRERGITGYFGAAPRVRYEVDFASPLWFGQEVTTTVVLQRIGTSSLIFRFEVWGEHTDQHSRRLAASGRYVTAHVPRGERTSAPWPAEWVAALEATDGRPWAGPAPTPTP